MDRSTYTVDPIDPSEAKFDKILVANRGEIACRVMRTARAMGIKTVAVHSEVDSGALHVRMADEAVLVGPAPAAESYLVMDRILDAVAKTGAQAVHPGYGFLSENTEFAKRLEDMGAVFVGPNSQAIHAMGDKIESKRVAANAKVNMIPGVDGEIATAEECVKVAAEIGYPVMIKASAGGGGKGMRVAWNEKEAREGFRLSQAEAASSFGDDRMLVEKYIDKGRHIEVQIMCDKHGNGVYLNERECSVQRRNQKVVEEAPSPFLTEEVRAAMGAQAVALAKAVGYDSAGTVEFLVDSQRNFYFLEMNTRLQVEHPITEEITGVDIVQQMLRAAYGHKLKINQADVGIRGWSTECRVYAEDATKGFGLPSVGRLTTYVEPRGVGVRCDSGIREGSEISVYYDPLICKLITHGKDRNESLDRMAHALDSYVIRGLTHNIPLLRDIVSEPVFRSGTYDTGYLPATYPDGFKGAQLSAGEEEKLMAISAALYALHERRSYPQPPAQFQYSLRSGEEGKRLNAAVSLTAEGQSLVRLGGKEVLVEGNLCLATPSLRLSVGGESLVVQLMWREAGSLGLAYKGSPFHFSVIPETGGELSRHMKVRPKPDLSRLTIAPMPGIVKSVAVAVGDMVTEAQELCVMEAMKMQNSLLAPKTGKVKLLHCQAGDTVDEGAVLIELE